MVKRLLLVLVWVNWRMGTVFSTQEEVQIGIGNFPIPDFKQQFIFPGDETFSTNQEMITNKPLDKYWQLHFDIKILDAFGPYRILKLTTETSSRLSLELTSDMGKIIMSRRVPKAASEFDKIEWRCKIGEEFQKWIRVEINNEEKTLKIILNNITCQENVKSFDLQLDNSKVKIAFGKEYQNSQAMVVRNMIFTNGLIDYLVNEVVNVREMKNIPTTKLFETFRIVLDLQINIESNRIVNIFTILTNTKEALINVTLENNNICFFYHPNEYKSCKQFELKTWTYLVVEQWANFSSFLVNTDIDKFSFNDPTTRKHVRNPKSYDVIFEPNLLIDVNIRKLRIYNPASNNFGIVRFKNKPFCQSSWTDENSRVVCNMLGHKNQTAITIDGSAFTNIKEFNFAQSVQCSKDDKTLSNCKHFRDNRCLSTGSLPAAVHCVKNTVVSQTDTDGVIKITVSGLPLCLENNAEASKICTQQNLKTESNTEKIPGRIISNRNDFAVYSIMNKESNYNCITYSDGQPQYTFNIEEHCSYNITHDCKGQQFQCAKCFKRELDFAINSLIYRGSNEAVIKSLEETLDYLKNKCEKWNDCDSVNPAYPDFCSVYNVASETLAILNQYNSESSTLSVKLTSEFNLQEYLKYKFIKISFDELHKSFSNGIKKIGNYFKELAEFDMKLAELDISYAKYVWENAISIIKEKEENLVSSIKELFGYALGSQVAALTFHTTKLAIQIAGSANPIKWLVDTDGSVTDKMDTGLDVKDAAANIISLITVLHNGIHELNNVLYPVKQRVQSNENDFKAVANILNKGYTRGALTHEESKMFLKLYGDFSPAIEKNTTDKYGSVIDNMIDLFSENIKSFNVLSAFGEQAINNVKVATKVLMGQYDVAAEKQIEIMDAYARSARAIIAKQNAENIMTTWNYTTLQEIKAMYLIREQKLRMYTDVCNIYTYQNHGRRPDVCTEILKNPDTDVIDLIAYNSKTDMCSDAAIVKKVVLIPLSITGNMSKGILSSNELFNSLPSGETDGSTYFQVPDREWMLENRWIENEMEGPFFLRKFELYLPPEASDVSFSYKIDMQLLHVSLGETKYVFKNTISNWISYRSGECRNPIDNPYNMERCRESLKPLCVLTPGQVTGDLLPPLEKSIWQVRLRSKKTLTMLYPASIMYLKAYVEFCCKDSIKRDTIPKRKKKKMKSCCNDVNSYFDMEAERNSTDITPNPQLFCKSCSQDSKPAFFGYFCQKCPSGYKESNKWFGCQNNTVINPKKIRKNSKSRWSLTGL